jgi:transcriptional regulator with XRE-family HTH domain
MPEPTDITETTGTNPAHTAHPASAGPGTGHIAARRQAIGALIRGLRERAGRKPRELAEFVGISTVALAAIESGDKECSLPQLEAIAYDLRVPVQTLLGTAELPAHERTAGNVNIADVLRLRGFMIGARLKQARIAHNETVQQTAEATGLQANALHSFELGRRQPDVTELESLMAHFGLALDDMLDIGIGPLGEAQLRQQQLAQFEAMSTEMRQFLCEPASLPSLLAAMRLRDMRPEQLRAIADAFNALVNGQEPA